MLSSLSRLLPYSFLAGDCSWATESVMAFPYMEAVVGELFIPSVMVPWLLLPRFTCHLRCEMNSFHRTPSWWVAFPSCLFSLYFLCFYLFLRIIFWGYYGWSFGFSISYSGLWNSGFFVNLGLLSMPGCESLSHQFHYINNLYFPSFPAL